MKIIFLLAVFWIQRYILAGAIPNCCTSKNVGRLEYTLLRVEDTSQYNCLTNCVYEKVGDPVPGRTYCFGTGDQKVECTGEATATNSPDNVETLTGDRIICEENLNKLHELLLDANNTIEVRCCANGYTNKTVSCGNGTDCSSACGDTPTCAKVVVNEPKEGKNYCESKERNTEDIHALFIGSVPCTPAINYTCNVVSYGTNLAPPDNTYCNNLINITAPGNPWVTLARNFNFTATCSKCDPACHHCSNLCPTLDFYNDKIAEFLGNMYEN